MPRSASTTSGSRAVRALRSTRTGGRPRRDGPAAEARRSIGHTRITQLETTTMTVTDLRTTPTSAERNKQRMQAIYAALETGDGRPFVEAMADDFSWEIPGR